MPAPSSKKAKKQRDLREWVGPATPAAPPRPSQVVQESTSLSPEGRHIDVVMERVSTGGTRHQAHFRRSALTPMTGQERMAKNRARKSLFAEQAAADRQQDTDRKRKQRELAKVSAPDPLLEVQTVALESEGRRVVALPNVAVEPPAVVASRREARHWLLVRRRLRRQV